MVRAGHHFSVFTDAGRAHEDYFQVGAEMASSPAHALARILTQQGWRARVEREQAVDLSSPQETPPELP